MQIPLYTDRETIINGIKDPPYKDFCTEQPIEIIKNENVTSNIIGIPNFWLTAISNNSTLKHLIQEYDKPILALLNEISVNRENDEGGSFTLEFKFSQGILV